MVKIYTMLWLPALVIFTLTLGAFQTEYNPYMEALRHRPWKSVQNYVEVRPGAFLFYWLYYADGTSVGADRKPLIIWVQGGPGLAASGIGNFAELGPLDMEMKPRNHTWVNGRNVLLIDHPVGTGFSYVTNDSLLVKTDREMGTYYMLTYDMNTDICDVFKSKETPGIRPTAGHRLPFMHERDRAKVPTLAQSGLGTSHTTLSFSSDVCRFPHDVFLHRIAIATDLSKVIKEFFKTHKSFRKTPTYLFGQSYGGKISPRLGYYLHTAIEKKRLKMNFRGIGIGSGWVSPRESTLVQPDFLYLMGVIGQNTYFAAKEIVKEMTTYIDKGKFMKALRIDLILYVLYHRESAIDINMNNINQVSPYPALDKLAVKVNKYVKPLLSPVVNQNLQWKYHSIKAHTSLYKNFFVPSTKFLELLLNNTKLKIAVYNGNLDVATPLAGASNWVHKLVWPGAQELKEAKRQPIRGFRNGFYKQSRQLSFWSVFGAGHWVPEDNPTAMEHILEYMMDDCNGDGNCQSDISNISP